MLAVGCLSERLGDMGGRKRIDPQPIQRATWEIKWNGHKVLDQFKVTQDHAVLVDEP
jgi:hypothetical protein